MEEKNVNKALKNLDWLALRQELNTIELTEKLLELALKKVLRADSMVRRRPGDDGTKRDHFLEELQNYLQEKGLDEAANVIVLLERIFHRIDKGYVAILSEEENLPFSKLSPEKRVSSILSFLEIIGGSIKLDNERAIKESKVIGPNMIIKDVTGTIYNPNATFHGFTLAATDALQLEGYRNSYFDAKGELVLPVPVSVNREDVAAAELKLFNASLWRRWKTVDERHRLLGATLQELTLPELPEWVSGSPDCEKIVTAFEFHPDSELEQLDTIASERFDARMIQTFQEMLLGTKVREIIAPRSARKVELPPAGAVSVEEVHAGSMLEQFLGLPLDQTRAGSLFLSERLRGYAVLRVLVDSSVEDDGLYFPIFTREEIQTELLRCGLSSSSADAFIAAATFNRSSRDMYDQPMIRISNGSYMIFGFSLIAADLVKVMISSLENARLSFPKRGPAFEKKIIEILCDNEFDAKTLKVKRGTPEKKEYDYDVTFVWGDYVFFMECKNRGIPFGNSIALANFEDELDEHADQVSRLRQALIDYPDIVTVDYPQAIGKKPVFCVVFSLPFSMGLKDGVYYIDESLLSRFFKPGGSLGVEMGRAKPGEPRYRIELAKLWAGDAPTPEDFIHYMENPPQLQVAKERYEIEAKFLLLSEDVALAYADWTRKSLTHAEEARILAGYGQRMKEQAEPSAEYPDA